MLTQQRLKELLTYDYDSGLFYRKLIIGSKGNPGDLAGHISRRLGYRIISVDGKQYFAHRLAWLYLYGEWPPYQVDHINRDRTDNKADNLRLATNRSEQMQNQNIRKDNVSGHQGVRWYLPYKKWVAYITVNKKRKTIGYFLNIEDAIAARKIFKKEFHTYNPENKL